MSNLVKILFEYEQSLQAASTESMWATPTPDGYQIDNIPFYAREVALGDVVSARPASDGALIFDRLVRPSGHSTVRLWFAAEHQDQVQGVRDHLRTLGCASELSDLPRLVAVDVPPEIDYAAIRVVLEDYERRAICEFEEACLGQR